MNDLNYANYDFEDLVDQLQKYMQTQQGAWKDLQTSSTGQLLIELFAYVANHVLFYTERRAEELFIDTAKNRQSVLNLVRLLNYTPRRVTSSTGYLTFSTNTPSTQVISIPKYTRCEGPGNTQYVTTENGIIQIGETQVEIRGAQGTLTQQVAISNGQGEQEIRIPHTNVEDSADDVFNTLTVLVNGVPWTKVSSFLRSASTSLHYRVLSNYDDTISILFGDGLKGAIPTTGDEILIQFLLSDGSSGNQFEPDTITTLLDTIIGSTGESIEINVTNDDGFIGGEPRETTENIKYYAPRVFATGQRSVTREDFRTILENTPGVLAANAWGEYDVMEATGEEDGILDMRNIVRFSLIASSGETTWDAPTNEQLGIILEDLKQLAMMTVKYEYHSPDIIDVIPVLYLTVESGVSLSALQNQIQTTIQNAFIPGTSISLGSSIRYSDIICAINQLDGVVYLNLVLKLYQVLDTLTGSYDYNGTLDVTDIKPRSVAVYINNVLSGIDDGDGSFITYTDGDMTDGEIDYETGVIGVNVGSISEVETIHVLYEQDGVGNIDLDFNQICRFDPSISWIQYGEIQYANED